jgi:hypothetical protein
MAGLPHAAPRAIALPDARRVVAWAGLIGVAGCGLARALEAVPARAAGLPWGLVGPLGGLGLRASATAVAAGIVAMTVAYGLVVWAGDAVPRAPALAVTGTLLAAFTLAPPHRGFDVFAYVAYGRMTAVHLNPYVSGPGLLGPDPIAGLYAPIFHATPSKYGALFTLLCAGLTPLGAMGATWALKLLSGLAATALLVLVDRAARRAGRDPTSAVVFAGLNPLFTAYAVAGAHNDLLMAALVLLALALRREAAGAGTIVLAAAIKPTAALVAPLLVAAARRRRAAVAGAAVAAAALAAVALPVFGDPARYALILERDGSGHNGRSVPELLRIGLGVDPFTPAGHHVLLGLFALVYVIVFALAWCRRLTVETASAWALVALLALSPVILVWYIVPALALAAISPSRAVRAAALALTVAFVALTPARHLLGV